MDKGLVHVTDSRGFDIWLKDNTTRPCLQDVIDYIRNKFAIDELFTEDELHEWARSNGYSQINE